MHHWFYDFRVNRRRYRATTETANKQEANKFAALERTRILEGRQGIRQQPDITFRSFANTYLTDYAEPHKRSVNRDRGNHPRTQSRLWVADPPRNHGAPDRAVQAGAVAGKWRGHKHTSAPKPIRPGTVNRELDTIRSLFSKAVEWGQLLEHPMRAVKRLKVDNRRTRILTEAEQVALLKACPKNLARLVRLALITGARIGELLALRWEACQDGP